MPLSNMLLQLRIASRGRNVLSSKRVALMSNYSTDAARPIETFINRNPRNGELLGTKTKSQGYYYKVLLTNTKTHTYGEVVDAEGVSVVGASTREQHIRENLYGTNTVSAARNVGRILAQRLKESGILGLIFDRQSRKFHGKVKAFAMGLKEGGIQFKE